MSIIYHDTHKIDLDQLTMLFNFVGWERRTADRDRLAQLVRGSLYAEGFDWIQAASSVTSTSGIPSWQTGQVPQEIPGSPCDNLKPWLNEAKTYRYLFAKGERNDWMRLLAIDEREKIIFYFRGSW